MNFVHNMAILYQLSSHWLLQFNVKIDEILSGLGDFVILKDNEKSYICSSSN